MELPVVARRRVYQGCIEGAEISVGKALRQERQLMTQFGH